MAPKAAQDRAKKKAAKQKKILIVLGVGLLGALVFAYTTLSKLNSTPSAAAAPPVANTPAGSVPAGTPVSAIIPGIAAAPVDPLSSFGSFGRKDPFHDNGPHASAASPSSTPASNSGGGGKSSGRIKDATGGGTTTPPKQPSAPLTGAVVSINGTKLALAIGGTFGQAPGLSGVPLFRLLSVTPKMAIVGVVGTPQRFTLHVAKPLTLEQAGGWLYTLILEPLGTPAPMTVAPTTTTTTTNGG